MESTKKFFALFSLKPGNAATDPGYSLCAASMDATASKSAFACVVITVKPLECRGFCFFKLFVPGN